MPEILAACDVVARALVVRIEFDGPRERPDRLVPLALPIQPQAFIEYLENASHVGKRFFAVVVQNFVEVDRAGFSSQNDPIDLAHLVTSVEAPDGRFAGRR